ncbi:MAG: FkbM family methyltransferase [Chloroflexi bacterium]|nr:FkbM family methyltransferase [Chloroflexota bacterium]
MKRLKALTYYGYSLLEMLIGFKNWPTILPLFLCRSQTGVRKLILRKPKVEILVRNAMDVWSVKETFLDQFYTRYGVSAQDGWTVIDIGAGVGDYSLYVSHGNQALTVYAFEPYQESYELLMRNLVNNDIENVRAFQQAVWSKAGKLQLDFSTGEPLQISSVEGIEQDGSSEKLFVDAMTLQELFNIELLDKVNLLKMDCEGAEYEILFNASPALLRKIERIIMEYHDLDESYHHTALMAFLEAQGYVVERYSNFVHKEIGYLFAFRP